MLSPCIRQVTHALLTRPPLSYTSLGFSITPFDLHVLSTPPAFILSQDQTLMLIVLFPSDSSSGFTSCSLNNSSLFLLEFSGLHYCLFVKELISHFVRDTDIRCISVSVVSATAYLEYHNSSAVSTAFLKFLSNNLSSIRDFNYFYSTTKLSISSHMTLVNIKLVFFTKLSKELCRMGFSVAPQSNA